MSSLVPRRPVQPESDMATIMGKKEIRGEPDKTTPGHPDTPHLGITTVHRLPEESLHDQFATKEDDIQPLRRSLQPRLRSYFETRPLTYDLRDHSLMLPDG